MPVEISVKNQGNSQVFTIAGYIDESVVFPRVHDKASQIIIDLAHVTGINSIGTRLWCAWVATMRTPGPVQAVNCPAILIKTFNTVLGAYPAHLQAISFFVPFFSAQDGSRKDFLYRLEREFFSNGTVKNPVITDATGNPMELDVLPNFFRFLKR